MTTSFLCVAGAVGFFGAAQAKQVRTYQTIISQAQKMTDEKEALATYLHAITIDATRTEAYDGIYE